MKKIYCLFLFLSFCQYNIYAQSRIKTDTAGKLLKGYHKINNEYDQITHDGYFENGILTEGREYFYGKLQGPPLHDHLSVDVRCDTCKVPKGDLIRVDVYVKGKLAIRFSGDFVNAKIYNGEKQVIDALGYVISIQSYEAGVEAGGFTGELCTYCNGQVMQKGFFKNGKFNTGEKRIYSAGGLLIKVELYKEGKYAGDAPLPVETNK